MDTDFNDLFAIFEYLLSLNYLYQVGEKHGYTWIPWGEYIGRGYHGRAQLENMFNDFFKNVEADKDNWAPIKAGMFGKSYKEYLETKENVDNLLLQLPVL